MKQAVEIVDEETSNQDQRGEAAEAAPSAPAADAQVEPQETEQPPKTRDLDPPRLVEAALFTAGRPVGVDELALATGLSQEVVKQAARSLEQEYEEREDQTALEVHMAGAKWAMQLKTVYVEHAQSLARMEIPKKTLKTLALIAFHQPMLQSELVDMIGSKTYEHVRELMEIGLVKSRPEGLSRRLTTSPEFPEYFGIPATDTQAIRVYLAKKVGLTLSELKGKPDLSDFQDVPASQEDVEQAVLAKLDQVEEEGAEDATTGEDGTGVGDAEQEDDTTIVQKEVEADSPSLPADGSDDPEAIAEPEHLES